MGWEMIRAGAITKRVVTELASLGVDIQVPPNARWIRGIAHCF